MLVQPFIQPVRMRRPMPRASRQIVRTWPHDDDACPILISPGVAGAAAGGTTSVAPGKPASPAIGQLMLMALVHKYPAASPSAVAGWTQLIQGQGGIGASGVDAGEVMLTVWTREVDQAYLDEVDTTVPITITGANSSVARIVSMTKPAGTAWSIASTKGVSAIPTFWSAAMEDNIDVRAGDALWDISGANSDLATAWVRPTIADNPLSPWQRERDIPGCVPRGTNAVSSSASTTQGDDCYLRGAFCFVAGGKSIGKMTFQMLPNASNATAPTGVTAFVRLRAA